MRAPITHVLGARPNFMKAAPVIGALAELGLEQRIVHTGQHYDERMSEVFFVQLGLPRPDVNLGVGSGSRRRAAAAASGWSTARANAAWRRGESSSAASAAARSPAPHSAAARP